MTLHPIAAMHASREARYVFSFLRRYGGTMRVGPRPGALAWHLPKLQRMARGVAAEHRVCN